MNDSWLISLFFAAILGVSIALYPVWNMRWLTRGPEIHSSKKMTVLAYSVAAGIGVLIGAAFMYGSGPVMLQYFYIGLYTSASHSKYIWPGTIS